VNQGIAVNIFRTTYICPFYKTAPDDILMIGEVEKDVPFVIDKNTFIIKDDSFSVVDENLLSFSISRTGSEKYDGPVFVQFIIFNTPKNLLI